MRAAWNQQLVTASLKTMHEKLNASATVAASSDRKRKPEEQSTRDITSERMAAINTLISASADRAGASDGAGPATVAPTGASALSPEQQRMAAALKISAALDAF